VSSKTYPSNQNIGQTGLTLSVWSYCHENFCSIIFSPYFTNHLQLINQFSLVTVIEKVPT